MGVRGTTQQRRPPELGGYESPTETPRATPSPPAQRTTKALHPPSRGGGTPANGHGSAAVPGGRRPTPARTPSSLNQAVARASLPGRPSGKVGVRHRISCFRWSWFLMTMATGGIANVLYTVPFKSKWLTVIGTIFFLFNIGLFIMNSVLIALRFHFSPGSLVDSFTHQVESLFIPAIVVSIAVILVNICQYGVPKSGDWLLMTLEAFFWMYMGLSILASAGMYLVLWSTQVFPLHTMTPVWVFPAYPLLLAAPFAGNLISAASDRDKVNAINSIPVTLCAVAVQATGFLISFMICAAFLYRLMTQKLPRDEQRPGIFISIGPSGFTVAGIVQLGSQADNIFEHDFLGVENSPSILKLLAYVTGLCLWAMCVWFFLVSVGSFWKYLKAPRKLSFQMTWFSFVFPTTALITATQQLGRAFESHGLQVFGTVMTGCIVLVWALVFTSMVRCLWRRELLWPEDVKFEE